MRYSRIQGIFRQVRTVLAAALMSAAAAALVLAAPVSAVSSSYAISNARESGVFNIGSSQGALRRTSDETLGKDVIEFSYKLPRKTVVGVWTKGYPASLDASSVNAVRIKVNVPSSEQAGEIAVALEIKGNKDVQKILLDLKPGWNTLKEAIDWHVVGNLTEAVFVVSPAGGSESVSGKIYFDLEFIKTALPKKGSAATGFSLIDARSSGVFNSGASQGSMSRAFDAALKKDVVKFNYTLPKKTGVGVWTKNFPDDLSADAVNAVKVAVKAASAEQIKDVIVELEIKGAKGTQKVPLGLDTGWAATQEPINWEMIGALKEAVFVVTPAPGAATVSGKLYFSLDFIKTELQKKGSPETGFSIADARANGVFNIGDSRGTAGRVFDATTKRYVLKLDYSAPPKTAIGVWTKNYPPELNGAAADAVTIGVIVPDPGQADKIVVKVEVKGTKNKQLIDLDLKQGRNAIREAIQWNKIGDISEIVFVVKSMGETPVQGDPVWFSPTAPVSTDTVKPVTGTLYFDLDFGKLTFTQKNATYIKIGMIAAVSTGLSLNLGLFGWVLGKRRARSKHTSAAADAAARGAFNGIMRDLLYGVTAVMVAAAAIKIYALGTVRPLDAGLNLSFLYIGFIGAFIAELLKYGLTGKHLTPLEFFQDVLFSGLLAVSSSNRLLLEAPAAWCDIFTNTNITSVIAFAAYHIINAYSLASSGRHARVITGALIVGTPYLFGWLLLTESGNILQILSNSLTGGFLASWPTVLEVMGRFLIVFVFNEAVTNGISFATKSKAVTTRKAHQYIFLISLGVAVAPVIADWGSTRMLGTQPLITRSLVSVLTAVFSQAGLWAEVYFITGIILDGIHLFAPSDEAIARHGSTGMRKGMAYSGIFMAILYLLNMLLNARLSQTVMAASPLVVGLLAGGLAFPLVKTIIESFDGSQPFFDRLRYSYRNPFLYVRGAVVGFGFAGMITQGLFDNQMSDRILFGFIVGLIASAGVSLARDAYYSRQGRGRIQTWRLYLTDSLLGIFVGSAAAFYLDASQVPVVVEKFKLYTSTGFSAVDYTTYPLLNKWGRIDLGSYTGGVKLLFTEVLAGVINWSIAAWLFAINRVFLEAFFQKDKTPIKFFFSKAGFVELMKHMIHVMRWGLWMSPIIFTFLRMMPDATWYNQDGAIRTLFATYHSLTMSPEAFQAWSLKIFIYVLAFDIVRVLIWMDHMGLRVATLVNLSFMGMDKLDEKVARFIGPAASQRYIPEAVKRFTTWAPLLIPFYLPRGQVWDYAWSASEAIQNASKGGGMIALLKTLSLPQGLALAGGMALCGTGVSYGVRYLKARKAGQREKVYDLVNREYRVTARENGEIFSELTQKGYDVSRRSYDIIDPCGRVLYIVDMDEKPESSRRAWPVLGNFPKDLSESPSVTQDADTLKIVTSKNGITARVDIRLPDKDSMAELWTITLENTTSTPRRLKIIPYLEWVLNRAADDRFHTQYARLYPEMQYVSDANAVFTWQKTTKTMGILAADAAPEGFLTSRMDFIGRAKSIWTPRVVEALAFKTAVDTPPCPTFDPIGSLLVNTAVGPNSSAEVRLMIGAAKNKEAAIKLVNKHLKPHTVHAAAAPKTRSKAPLIGHGEILPGTPQPYYTFSYDGNKLFVHTPYTPRPYDHALSNPLHSVMVTNRGLHTSCNGNSQQNRLTPDWADTVTKEIPGEAIYLFDPDDNEWYSPTHHPLNQADAVNESEFSVDGTAVFRMTRGSISTELTVFVPIDEPAGVYLLTIKNNGDKPRRMRVAPYFQMALSLAPEKSGPLVQNHDRELNALFFENPRNIFRSGPAFASMSIAPETVETRRGRFFGHGRGVQHPYIVEKGVPDTANVLDDKQIAGFVGTVTIPAGGESTVAVILGQTDTKKQAVPIIEKYKDTAAAKKSLDDTRRWWLNLMGTVDVKTNNPEFDHYQNWLKYQAVAERIWARRGFYQTSGAFGFRDQLQDTVNLMWVDPALARKQIILHASQQFIEGDVFHWFFTLTDGRTSFASRSHASDNLLWLVWGVAEYIKATNDMTILDEMTSYVVSKDPFMPLPKNKGGWGDFYQRSTRADSVYRHCMTSIDLVLEKRMGRNGLPLMGTGDWNDGLDDIGCEGKGESVWLALFLYYILKEMAPIIETKDGADRKEYYAVKMKELEAAIEKTWRDDRYLRAIHDDGTEIGVKDSGIWEIDALTASWAVMAGVNFDRARTVFNTALKVLEKDNAILLGWPALREDTKPYLGRSSKYPEGVRENGMYCHGVQWLVKAARILSERLEAHGDKAGADEYRAAAYRLWGKIAPLSHMTQTEIEIYGGQPNKQAADMLTTFDCGRMIWHGYTGAAGWMLRQSMEGVIGASLVNNQLILPADLDKPRGDLKINRVSRSLEKSPFQK